tara:strand:+ start:484 stop:1206 length:723 start_codon:yes stop_codon:yes gene_type:complete
MNIIKRNIPNFITLINLTLGLYSIILTFNNHIILAGILILFGAILDFLDGFTARILNAYSELGKQLDSMADLITFGVAPGIILLTLIENGTTLHTFSDYIPHSFYSKASFIALAIPIFSAIRLAKFNIDNKQSISFIGLPTPIVAIFIASLPMAIKQQEIAIFADKIFLIIMTAIFSFLLVSKISFFSLKNISRLTDKENILKFSTIILSLALLFIFKLSAIPFIVILYITIAIINNIYT